MNSLTSPTNSSHTNSARTNSSLINTPLLIEQLKRFWVIGVVLMLIYLLTGILPLYSAGGPNVQFDLDAAFWRARALTGLISMAHPTPLIVMIIGPIASAMAFYPYFFGQSAASAFYSFPVNKKQLFWTNFAASMILMLGPLLIFCLILLIPIVYPGQSTWGGIVHFNQVLFPRGLQAGQIINTFPVIAGFFGRIAIGTIFYYSVFLLAVTVSGNRVVAVLLSGAMPLIPISIHGLIEGIANMYVFGHDTAQGGARFASTFAYSNPIMWSYWIEGWGPIGGINQFIPVSLWPYMLIYAGIAVALIIISYTCSHRRKLERTGDSVVFTAMNNVCVFLVAMSGMIFMGLFLMAVLNSRVALYIGFVLGFAIAYIIGQMIAERAIDVRHKFTGLIPYGGVMASMYILLLLITNFGMNSYINRLPHPSEVYGVSTSHTFRNQRTSSLGHHYVTDPDIIAQTIDIHRQILENRRPLQDARWRTLAGNWHGVSNIPITYILHDGTIMSRTYHIPFDFEQSVGLNDLRNSPAMRIAEMPILRHPELIESVSIDIWQLDRGLARQDAWSEFVTTRGYEEISSLFEAMMEDYTDLFTNIVYRPQEDTHIELNFSVRIRPQYQHTHPWGVWVQTIRTPYAENTLAWLEERGYFVGQLTR